MEEFNARLEAKTKKHSIKENVESRVKNMAARHMGRRGGAQGYLTNDYNAGLRYIVWGTDRVVQNKYHKQINWWQDELCCDSGR